MESISSLFLTMIEETTQESKEVTQVGTVKGETGINPHWQDLPQLQNNNLNHHTIALL